MFIDSTPPPFTDEDDLVRLKSIPVKLPEIPTQINFMFNEHDEEEHLSPSFRQMVESSDVVLIEQLVRPGDKEKLNAVSQGNRAAFAEEIDDATRRRDGYGAALAKALFGSKKPIQLPDLQASRKVRDTHRVYLHPGPEAYKGVRSTNDLVRAFGRIYQGLCEHVLFARDKNFLRTIYPSIEEALDSSKLPEITALFTVGAIHRTLPFMLQKRIAEQGKTGVHTTTETYFGNTDTPLHDLYKAYLQKRPFSQADILRYYFHRAPEFDTIQATDPALRTVSADELYELVDQKFANILKGQQ